MRARRAALCALAVVFLAGAWMVGSKLYDRSRAEGALRQLQTSARDGASSGPTQPPLADGEAMPASEAQETVAGGQSAAFAGEQARWSAMDFAALREVNEEIVAWISGEGTSLDYPVLQGADNEYYLRHLYDGTVNGYGSLFLDYRCSGEFTDRNTVIYGHHIKTGAMFGILPKYRSQAFYEAVPKLTLYTPLGDYEIELVSGTVEDGSYEFVRFAFSGDEDFLAYIDDLRARSTFRSNVTVRAEDRIVSLCTCTYERSNARYMLVGKLTPISPEP